ncbi:antitoxin VbhA family protein [Breznakia pachnodae]|uniref:Antitoxin VbhA domain-containing protein n=1 Tax=Breznakia pachnodae TaxID=265178 RepID=A0ABU0E049_9FIRM|nr:antitoxin VbhA family protein [Breznakia pachnodae]MDQ0360271.1 hypothetical protein [Breznakia pachnodae]
MKEETKNIIDRVNATMALEGMPLTEEIKEKLRKCIEGESTTEIERQKIIDKYLSKI